MSLLGRHGIGSARPRARGPRSAGRLPWSALALLSCVAWTPALDAQGPPGEGLDGFEPAADQEAPAQDQNGSWTTLGTVKWATLAISGGSAIYGFSLNSQADDLFVALEQICETEPERCEARNPDGSFADDELEQIYQDTVDKDRQARAALIVSQITLAATVVFFIMDLSNRPPENVPYDPPVTLALQPLESGRTAVGLRIRTP